MALTALVLGVTSVLRPPLRLRAVLAALLLVLSSMPACAAAAAMALRSRPCPADSSFSSLSVTSVSSCGIPSKKVSSSMVLRPREGSTALLLLTGRLREALSCSCLLSVESSGTSASLPTAPALSG